MDIHEVNLETFIINERQLLSFHQAKTGENLQIELALNAVKKYKIRIL